MLNWLNGDDVVITGVVLPGISSGRKIDLEVVPAVIAVVLGYADTFPSRPDLPDANADGLNCVAAIIPVSNKPQTITPNAQTMAGLGS